MWTMEWHSFLGPLGSGAQVYQTRFPLRKWDVFWGYVKNLLRTNVVDLSPIQVGEVNLGHLRLTSCAMIHSERATTGLVS